MSASQPIRVRLFNLRYLHRGMLYQARLKIAVFNRAEMAETFKAIFRVSPATTFLAFLNGEPVGGAGMATFDGVANLFGASTLPAFRNRGVQTALIQTRLAFAVASGCDFAKVTTLPGSGSQRNVERQGFQVAYTRTVFVKEKN